MRIRSTVKLAIFLSISLMLSFIAYTIVINRLIDARLQDLRTSAEVSDLFGQLQDLTGDYFLYRTERADQQVRILQGDLLQLLNSQKYQKFQRRYQTDSIHDRLQLMSEAYNKLTATFAKKGLSQDEATQEFQNRLITQVTITDREIADSLNEISNNIREEVLSLRRFSSLLGLIALILIVSYIIGMSLLLSKSVVQPVLNLYEGMKIISCGNLDFRVEPAGPGEIRELSQGFNQMTASLSKLTATLRKSQEDLRYLTSELITAQERERQHLGLELHDDLGQLLMVLKMRLRAVQRNLSPDAAGSRDELEDALTFVNEIVERIRQLSRSLRPTVLEDMGLNTGLKLLFEDFQKYHGLRLSVAMDDIEKLFPWENQIVIYRIFQESLTNVAKHAGATAVMVAIKKLDGCVDFQMQDNGCGFNVQQVLEKHSGSRGLGLAALDERVRMLGGDLHFWSQPGQGTRLHFTVPVEHLEG
jgi:signal transduction histidine kinase